MVEPGTSGTRGGRGSDHRPSPPPARARGRRLRYEALLALELLALTTFTFGRPVLDSFGRSPETFIARGAGSREIVLFGVLVVVIPALASTSVGLASHVLGRRVRRLVHLVLIAGLGGLGAWRLGQDLTGWARGRAELVAGAVLAGVALGVLRVMVSPTRTFLRFAGVAAVAFPLQFLLTSPTSALIGGERPTVDPEVAAGVAADLGDDPPPVVVVVFDALPTMALLDGEGGIDRETFPNIAELAGTSTWYRNATTISGLTGESVPAILTGRYPDPSGSSGPDPQNLFTLLGGSYDMQVAERITDLCPEELCPPVQSAGVGRLLADAAELWSGGAARELVDDEGFDLPAVLGDDRYEAAEDFIHTTRGRAAGRPQFTFLHVVLPHNPWQFLPDGTRYEAVDDLPTGQYAFAWSDSGLAVGRQRFLLQAQAADRLLGELIDELRAADTFDDAVMVVTSDHGEAFFPEDQWRMPSEGNLSSILWTPLLVKEPGQTEGRVDDANVQSIDVVPTIADLLGVELPWAVDGMPVGDAAGRDPAVKELVPNERYLLEPEGDDAMITVDARAGFAEVMDSRMVGGSGPDAVWRRTRHGGLVGRDVAELAVGQARDDAIDVVPTGLDDVDLDGPLTLELVGRTQLEVGTVVAYALNGTIGAVTEVEPWGLEPDHHLAHGLLPPRLFVEGENELTAYVVDGAPGDETLWPLTLM
ncbi:MAG: sulfatase-like hydrolase/transferase [Acidimicrobiia bacterium]